MSYYGWSNRSNGAICIIDICRWQYNVVQILFFLSVKQSSVPFLVNNFQTANSDYQHFWRITRFSNMVIRWITRFYLLIRTLKGALIKFDGVYRQSFAKLSLKGASHDRPKIVYTFSTPTDCFTCIQRPCIQYLTHLQYFLKKHKILEKR